MPGRSGDRAWTRAELEAALSDDGRPSLNGADLRGLDLSGLDLSGLDLAYARLDEADLSGTALRRAVLFAVQAPDTCLRAADLRGANLTAAHLPRADLTAARLDGAELAGTDLTGVWTEVDATLAARGAIVRPGPPDIEPPDIEPPDGELVAPTVTVAVGDVVRITLSEPGATGYVWSAATGLEPVMDAAEPTVSVSVSADATAGAVGGAVERVFRFRARRRGDVRIVLRLAPAWGDAPVRTRTVDVQVRTRHPETGP